MVARRRPATATGGSVLHPSHPLPGMGRPPPVPIIAAPSAAVAVPQSFVLPHQASLRNGTKVRPMSAFRVSSATASTRSLSWNDSAILNTEETPPTAVRRSSAQDSTIPAVVKKGGSMMKLDDVTPTSTPLYTALKANLPSRHTNTTHDFLPGHVADHRSNTDDEEEDSGLPMRIAELLDDDVDRSWRCANTPIKKAALLDEGTQTHLENRPRATQTEFSVSLVAMIEGALTSAAGPDDASRTAARRQSLPAAMDPTTLNSLLNFPSPPSPPPPPAADLVTALHAAPESETAHDITTTGTQPAGASVRRETADASVQTQPLDLPATAATASHLASQPSSSSKRLVPPVMDMPVLDKLVPLPELGPSLEREAVVLKLTIIEAAELGQSKFYGLSDPYCIVSVEGTTKRTRIIPSTQDPKWDEDFRFCLKSFTSPVSLAVMDKHAARENKLMGVLEFVPGELLLKVCDSVDQTAVEADAWVVLQNKAGIPGGGRVLIRLSTSDFRPMEKTKTRDGVFNITDLANVCLSKHDEQTGDGSSPHPPGSQAPAKEGSGLASVKGAGSMRSSVGHRQPVAAILEDPADLIDLFEGQKPLDEGVEQGYYSRRSLYLFEKDSVFRHRVFNVVSSPLFHALSWLAAALACLAMGLDPQPVSINNTVYSTLEFVSYLLLGIEILLKSIAFGFSEKSQSFMFSAVWNVIDLVAMLSYAVEFAMPSGSASDFTLRPFRFFRILSPLAQFEVFTGLTTIFLSLKTAFWPFATVIAFLMLFFVGFGIFGVTFYHHSYARRCVNPQTREVMVPNRSCKAFDGGGSSCSEDQDCQVIVSNELGSVINFDHITNAFVSIFQAISLDGQPDIMNTAVQGEPNYAALGVLFFLLLTFFCRFLLFNLCVAVVTTTFQQVRKDVSAALDALYSKNATGSLESISPHIGSSAQSIDPFVSHVSSGAGRRSTTSSVGSSFHTSASTSAPSFARRRRTQGLARRSLHEIAVSIVAHPLFEALSMASVLVNTIAMARQAADIPASELKTLSNFEIGTQCLFVVELLFRMLGANSLPEFFSRGHDKFDFFVILLTGMCLFARIFGVSKEKLGLLATFSALRFIRLVSVIPSINHLLTLTLASVTNIVNLLFFSFAFFSVYAVCAVFIFGSDPTDIASQDYANYWTAMKTLFAIFIGDDWRFYLYSAMQHGIETSNWWRTLMPCGFILAFFFFSQAVLVNLYIAVIIENFSVATTQKHAGKDPQMLAKLKKLNQFVKSVVKSWFKVELLVRAPSARVADSRTGMQTHSAHHAEAQHHSEHHEHHEHHHPHQQEPHAGQQCETTAREFGRATSNGSVVFHHDDRSCFWLWPDNALRVWCTRATQTRWFQTLILFIIFLSMIALAIEPPTRDIEPAIPYAVLDAINYVSTVVFLFEFCVQAITLGLLFTPDAYFKSAWNAVDFIVLVLSLLDIFGGNTKAARVLRLGRALRPLRLIKRNQGMRLMLDALLATWKPVSMIVILAFAVATIFAIMGMSLFKGRFSFCNDPASIYPMGRLECVGTHMAEEQGVLMPSAWTAPEENFDSFTRAMMQCLTMNTMQVANLFQSASDVTEPGKALVTDGNAENVVFLVMYLIIGGLFVTNLFVAFIIDGFNQLRKVDAKNLETIANYDVFVSLVRRSSPHRQHSLPTHWLRAAIAKHVLPSSIFEHSSTLFVFLNVFFLALYHPGRMSDEMERLYDLQNDIFLGLMVLEAALIIAGKGWMNYLEDRWNWIDIISIIATCVAYFLPESAFIRSFRLVKILRIIKNVKALQAMFETLARAIPQFTNVMLLLFLILSMFAILCVNLFGLVREGPLRLGSPMAPWPSMRPTFKSYPVAMYTLFLVTQGEDWNLLVYDCAVQAPFCTEQFEGKDYGDCGVTLLGSFLIFFAFKLVAEFVLINLFVGMIIDTFTSQSSSHVAVQFNFDVRSNTHYVKNAAATTQKRGSVVKATTSAPSIAATKMPSTNKSYRGSSRQAKKQIDDNLSCAECWKHMTGGGRRDFILIPDVQVLMRMLPQPLGFARDALGIPTMTSYDRAICKLIWAELNILATQRSEESKSWWRQTQNTVRGWFGFDLPVPAETGLVTFDETFLTLFHWRCPELVPEEVRKQREPMLDEVVKTAHAVSISRHIRRWLAMAKIRKQRRANKNEEGRLAPAAATTLMLMGTAQEDMQKTQEDMQREVEARKDELVAPTKMARSNSNHSIGRLKKIHAVGGVGALSRTSIDESETEDWRAGRSSESNTVPDDGTTATFT